MGIYRGGKVLVDRGFEALAHMFAQALVTPTCLPLTVNCMARIPSRGPARMWPKFRLTTSGSEGGSNIVPRPKRVNRPAMTSNILDINKLFQCFTLYPRVALANFRRRRCNDRMCITSRHLATVQRTILIPGWFNIPAIWSPD